MKSFIKYLLLSLTVFSFTGCIKEEVKEDIVSIGDKIPEFSVQTNDGKTVTDKDMYGAVSCIVFFHTSCPDCQNLLPSMNKIYGEYIEKGVRFLLISREESEDSIQEYWAANGLDMPYSAQETREVYGLFASLRIPRVYISNENGIIRHIYTDNPVPTYSDLKDTIESLIR